MVLRVGSCAGHSRYRQIVFAAWNRIDIARKPPLTETSFDKCVGSLMANFARRDALELDTDLTTRFAALVQILRSDVCFAAQRTAILQKDKSIDERRPIVKSFYAIIASLHSDKGIRDVLSKLWEDVAKPLFATGEWPIDTIPVFFNALEAGALVRIEHASRDNPVPDQMSAEQAADVIRRIHAFGSACVEGLLDA